MADPSIAVGLGRLVAAFSPDAVSERAAEVARKCLVDTIGVALAGSSEPETRIVAAIHGSSQGDAVVLGRPERAGALEAALVNGMAAHALDFDDMSEVLGGHPSAPVVAALLALASHRSSTGAEFLTAYIVGCEVSISLAPAVHPHHYDKGWHPTATLGVFGVAAACANLLGLSAEETATALAISASMSSGLKANFGTMVKPLHVGLTARSGLTAALLAAEGFSANLDAFEHHQGFFEVFNGPGTYDASAVLGRFANPIKLGEESIVIKRYACCGSTHAAIDGARSIAARPDHDPFGIRSVKIRMPMQRLRHTDRSHPVTALDGRFSVQYLAARALLDGDVLLGDFRSGRVVEDSVIELLARTSAISIEPGEDGVGEWGAEVTVDYEDGHRVVETIADITARGSAVHIPWDGIESKFFDCARGVLTDAAADRLLRGLRGIESVQDVGRLIGLAST